MVQSQLCIVELKCFVADIVRNRPFRFLSEPMSVETSSEVAGGKSLFWRKVRKATNVKILLWKSKNCGAWESTEISAISRFDGAVCNFFIAKGLVDLLCAF